MVWVNVRRYGVFQVTGSNVNTLRDVVCAYLRLEIAPPLLRVRTHEGNKLEPWEPVPDTSPSQPLALDHEQDPSPRLDIAEPIKSFSYSAYPRREFLYFWL